MKKTQLPISGMSWLILNCFLLLYFVVFRPTLKEFGVFFLADYLALLLMQYLERKLFVRVFPEAFLYFEGCHFELVKSSSTDDWVALYKSMTTFPLRRARYCLLMSAIKVVPAVAIIIFYWHHSWSLFQQATMAVLIPSVVLAYFYSIVYIESHDLISKRIAEFHRVLNWTEVFRRAQPTLPRKEEHFHNLTGLISIWIFMLLLQWDLVAQRAVYGPKWTGLLTVLTGVGGLALVTRIWFLDRRFFIGGLRTIFERLESFDPESTSETLALHSAPELSYFEKVYNSLSEKLREYQQELSRWVFYQTEESRYRALGELSALIVHDLSAPLHVIQFCTEQLREDPQLIQNPRYLDQLSVNGRRSLELINSLKAYLKEGTFKPSGAVFGDAHEQVLRLLETQFEAAWFRSVTIDKENGIDALALRIPKADLIHVLLNLYRNSLDNLFQNGVPAPRVRIWANELTEEQATISIEDNGTGLSVERFEALTAFHFSPVSAKQDRTGLGLRLVRRLIERSHGSLTAVNPEPGQSGARFCLRLPIVKAGQPREEEQTA